MKIRWSIFYSSNCGDNKFWHPAVSIDFSWWKTNHGELFSLFLVSSSLIAFSDIEEQGKIGNVRGGILAHMEFPLLPQPSTGLELNMTCNFLWIHFLLKKGNSANKIRLWETIGARLRTNIDIICMLSSVVHLRGWTWTKRLTFQIVTLTLYQRAM